VSNDNYHVNYNFSYSSSGYGAIGFPDENYNLSFDGTDLKIDVIVQQFEKVLRSAGYVFDHLEVVTGADE
jgi:hypothetical protein